MNNRENIKKEFEKLNKRSNLLRLAGMMKPYKGLLVGCVFLVIVVNIAELIKPLAAKVVIDDFILGAKAQSGVYSITGLGIAYFILVVIGALCQIMQARLVSRMSQGILNDIRKAVFNRIESLPIKVLDRYGTGRLITRCTNDVETINEFYSDVFINLFRDVFLLLGIVIFMLTIDVGLALISFTAMERCLPIRMSLPRVITERILRFPRAATCFLTTFFGK